MTWLKFISNYYFLILARLKSPQKSAPDYACYALLADAWEWVHQQNTAHRHLRWHLFLGLPDSGKKEVVRKNGATILAETQLSQQLSIFLTSTDVYIIVDTPTAIRQQISYKQFFYYARVKNKIASLVFCSNILSLREAAANKILLHHLAPLQKLFPQVPAFLLLTQTDRLLGFTPFFARCDDDQRQQACGFLIAPEGKEKRIQAWQRIFKQWLQALQQQSIKIVHHAAVEDRSAIFAFPLQIETLSESLAHCVSTANIRGCYFSSAKQNVTGTTQDYLLDPLPKALSVYRSENMNAQDYFISGFFNTVLTGVSEQLVKRRNYHRHAILFLGLFFATAMAVLLAYQHAQKSWHAMRNSAQHLAAYQNLQNLSPTTATAFATLLPQLDELAASAHESALPQKIKVNAEHIYHLALQKQLLALIQNQLSKTIQQQSKQDILHLYPSLQVYLMLHYPQHRNTQLLLDWIFQHANLSAHEKTTLQKHLAVFFEILPAQPVDKSLVQQARNALKQLPKPLLAFMVLQNQNAAVSANPLQKYARVLPKSVTQVSVPTLFLPGNADHYLQEAIPRLCQQMATASWVLGRTEENNNLSSLIADTQAIYKTEYYNWWHEHLDFWQDTHFSDLDQTIRYLTLWSDPKTSPLPLMINILDLEKNISPITIQALQNKLILLTKTLNTIKNSDDSGRAAFLVAKQHFQNTANATSLFSALLLTKEVAPYRLSNWLTKVSEESFALILAHSALHIQKQWQPIYDFYQAKIKMRFPLVSTENEINPSDFTHFFGPKGLMTSFMNEYIQPFVEINDAPWRIKQWQGLGIPINQKILNQFMRAQIIKQMFFIKDQLQVPFSLQASEFAPQVTRFSLHMNNNKIDDLPGVFIPHHLHWQGDQQDNLASFNFENLEGQHAVLEKKGSWAWLRLLQNRLQTTMDPKHYQIVFDSDGNSVKYELVADKPINPFLPGVIDAFSCQKELLG